MDLESITRWLSPDIVESAMVTTTRLANSAGTDSVGIKLSIRVSSDGSVNQVLVDDQAPIPDKSSPEHFTVPRRMMRFSNLKRTHEYFEGFTHDKAVDALRHAVAEQHRLAIYLRSFELSGTAIQAAFPGAESLYSGQQVTSTIPRTDDRLVQEQLLSKIRTPLIAVGNRADSVHSGLIPELVCAADQWMISVESLVKYATPIFVLIGPPSEGVLQELTAIRRHRKCHHAILIHSEPSRQPRALTDFIDISRLHTPVKSSWEELLSNFPYQLAVNEIPELLESFVSKIQKSEHPEGTNEVIIPINYGPPTTAANASALEAENWLQQAVQFALAERDFEAEDLAYRAVVISFFCHADNLRAMAYWVLGRIAQRLHADVEARELHEWAHSLATRLGDTELAGAALMSIDKLKMWASL